METEKNKACLALQMRPLTLAHGQLVNILLVVLLAAIIAVLLVKPAIILPVEVPVNYNEGWNAFHADRAIRGAALYPEITAHITNNYPPLSFYITGSLGSLLGDNILAGRILNLISIFLIALNVGLITRRLGCHPVIATFSGLIFIAYLARFADEYVASNTPQLMAHALMTAGLVIFLYLYGKRASFPALVPALMLLGGLTKHNLIPLPLSMTVWLFLNDCRSFKRWILISLVLLSGLFISAYVFYGTDFFSALLNTPRRFVPYKLISMLRYWMLPLTPLFGAALLLILLDRGNRHVQLVLLYILFSATWGVFTGLGEGVSVNSMFDLLIALAIAAGLAVKNLQERLPSEALAGGLLIAYLMLPLIILLPQKLLGLEDFLATFDKKRETMASDIGFIAAQMGPAACRNYSLCYWAGKEFEMDFFNTREKITAGVIDEDTISQLLADRYYSVIQLLPSDRRDSGEPDIGFPGSTRIHMNKHYRVHHENEYSTILVPR